MRTSFSKRMPVVLKYSKFTDLSGHRKAFFRLRREVPEVDALALANTRIEQKREKYKQKPTIRKRKKMNQQEERVKAGERECKLQEMQFEEETQNSKKSH